MQTIFRPKMHYRFRILCIQSLIPPDTRRKTPGVWTQTPISACLATRRSHCYVLFHETTCMHSGWRDRVYKELADLQ